MLKHLLSTLLDNLLFSVWLIFLNMFLLLSISTYHTQYMKSYPQLSLTIYATLLKMNSKLNYLVFYFGFFDFCNMWIYYFKFFQGGWPNMCDPLSGDVTVKKLFVISKERKPKSLLQSSFNNKLPGISMLELAVKQSPHHGSVSPNPLDSQRSEISVARRQLPLSVLVERGTALTDWMWIQKSQHDYKKSIFTKHF